MASKTGTRDRARAALLATVGGHCYIWYRTNGRGWVHGYLRRQVLRNLFFATCIGVCAFTLFSDQSSADSPPPSISSESDACGKAEECFQAAALPKERLGTALNKEQVLSLKLSRLQRLRERFPA